MVLFAKSEENIFGELLYDTVNNTNLRRVSPGSKLRTLSAALSKQLGKAYKKFDVNIAQSFLDGAQGKYLEYIGDVLGVAKLGATQTALASADRNVKFYVDSGTFGDINSSNSILITSGTIISTGDNNTGIQYFVPYNVILSASLSETYVAVQAMQAGSVANVGSNQLIYHNFSDYADVLNDTLKVTNEAEILKGQDVEPEENYRYRIANQTLAAEAGNETAIRLAALNVPGVADVIPIPYFKGIGTGELLIKSVTPSISSGLIAAVQETVDSIKSYGDFINVRGPIETGFSSVATLTLKKKLSLSEQTKIINTVTTNMIDYIDNLDIGEDFIVNEAVERVMSSSAEIKNIGSANKPFDNLYIYKETKLQDNKMRNTLLGDYSPQIDERLIVETRYAGNTPILFRIL